MSISNIDKGNTNRILRGMYPRLTEKLSRSTCLIQRRSNNAESKGENKLCVVLERSRKGTSRSNPNNPLRDQGCRKPMSQPTHNSRPNDQNRTLDSTIGKRKSPTTNPSIGGETKTKQYHGGANHRVKSRETNLEIL